MKLSFRKIALEPKESFKLKVSGAKGKVRWTSTKKKVAVVTAKGKVTAKKKGKAVIRAKAGKRRMPAR